MGVNRGEIGLILMDSIINYSNHSIRVGMGNVVEGGIVDLLYIKNTLMDSTRRERGRKKKRKKVDSKTNTRGREGEITHSLQL